MWFVYFDPATAEKQLARSAVTPRRLSCLYGNPWFPPLDGGLAVSLHAMNVCFHGHIITPLFQRIYGKSRSGGPQLISFCICRNQRFPGPRVFPPGNDADRVEGRIRIYDTCRRRRGDASSPAAADGYINIEGVPPGGSSAVLKWEPRRLRRGGFPRFLERPAVFPRAAAPAAGLVVETGAGPAGFAGRASRPPAGASLLRWGKAKPAAQSGM